MIAQGTDAAHVTADQSTQVAADVELFCRAHKIARAAVAKAVGYSPGVISEFLKGQYKGSVGQVAIDLENWLTEEEGRQAQPQLTQFVWTNLAMEIKAVSSYCLDKRKISLIYGPDTSGIGKTTALQAIHQSLGPRRSTLVTIDKVDANPSGLLRKICQAMRLQDSGTNKRRFDRIVSQLEGRSHLMMIDQIHSLRGSTDDKPFYVLADLYDATKSAQLWCGTADLVAYLQRRRVRNHDESLSQISSRIFPCVDLMESIRGTDGGGDQLVTVDQVVEMFAKNKLRLGRPAAKWLCDICNQPDSGAVRLCVSVFEYAVMMAEMRNATVIDIPLLQAAMRRAVGQRGEVLMRRMAVEAERISKVG